MSRGRTALLLVAFALASACRDQGAPERGADESLGQRVFRAPAGVVRAVPPHRIQPNGIGPYLLGNDFKSVLSTLPHGPRVEVIQIERVVDYRLVRVAQDAILVGIGQTGSAAFVAALDPEIAKTEDGWGVGSEIDSLREALGPERQLAGARDPHLVELTRLPNARVILAGHRVAGIVVGPDASAETGRRRGLGPADALSGGGAGRAAGDAGKPPRSTPPADSSDCTVSRAMEALGGEPVVETARATDSKEAAVHYGCFTSGDPEAVVADKDQLILVVGEAGHLRRAASTSVSGLLFASAADVDGDGRHDVIAVAEERSNEVVAIRIEVLRGDGGRLVGAADQEVYRVTANAALAVAKLKDIQLLIEAQAAGDGLEVGGFFLQWDGDEVRSVAPLVPRSVEMGSRRRNGAGAGQAAESDGSSESTGDRADDDHGQAASSARGKLRPRALRPSARREDSGESR